MTSNIVRPLQIASEKLLDALGTIRLRARNEGRECRLQDSEVVRALVNFRNAVWMLTPSTNQALKGYLFRLDQILDQIRDRMLQILVERLFRGEMTAEEGAMAVALLSGRERQWRDPRGDLDRLEALSPARSLDESPAGFGFV